MTGAATAGEAGLLASTRESTQWNTRTYRIVFILVALLAFAVHFRPWEVAFLEEWPLAEYWVNRGPLAFVEHYAEWSLSRPLHLAPTAIGLAISGGAPGGIFLVLGLVAAAQFAMMMWALRPVARSFWTSAAVSMFVALHPLWPGGFLQRFLPAQTAALALIIAAGFLIRWLQQGRARWIVCSGVAVSLGLCVYPGVAVAAPLASVVLALCVPSTLRRRLVAVTVMISTSALMSGYSLVVTRWINPGQGTYEADNFAAATIVAPRDAVRYIASALVTEGTVVVAGVLAIAALGAILALTGSIPHWAGWLMFGSAMASPLCAIVFFGNATWLQDIDRVGYATSLGLAWALAVWPLTSFARRVNIEAGIALMLAVVSVVGAARGISVWQPYITLQHTLLAELAPVVADAKGDDIVVVVDHSGTYGSEYTLPQHYINSASHVMNQDKTVVWLCYLAEDPPLDGATLCDPRDTGEELRLAASFATPRGSVDILVGRR